MAGVSAAARVVWAARSLVWIEAPTVAGALALNDAELSSFLGHELLHAYHYRFGPYEPGIKEFFRREIEAYRWELAHMSQGVRPFYRAEAESKLILFESLLATADEPPPPETSSSR